MLKNYTQPPQWADANTTNTMDVMGCLRRICTASVKAFGELCKRKMAQRLCSRSNRIDFIFDIYVEGSVKDSERVRKCTCRPIDINVVSSEMQLSVSMDAF